MEGLMVLFGSGYWLQPPNDLYWPAFHTGLASSGQACQIPYFQFMSLTVLFLIYPEFPTLHGEWCYYGSPSVHHIVKRSQDNILIYISYIICLLNCHTVFLLLSLSLIPAYVIPLYPHIKYQNKIYPNIYINNPIWQYIILWVRSDYTCPMGLFCPIQSFT